MKNILLILSLLLMSFIAHAQSTAMQALVTFTATTTSAQAMPAAIDRKYLLVQNKGAVSVYLKFDSAHSANEGVVIVAGGNYEVLKAPTNAIYIKSASSTSEVAIYEGK